MILVPSACQQEDLDARRHHRLSLLVEEAGRRDAACNGHPGRGANLWRCLRDVMYPRCCGLDVHKKTVVAGCLLRTEGPEPVQEMRTLRTMPADLLALADGLQESGCPHVAMESTGVYWAPRL